MKKHEELKLELGKRLKTAIGDRSYTGVANDVGVKPHTFWGYVNGVSLPSFDVLIKISAKLNVSTDWLLTGKEAPRAPEAAPPGKVYDPELMREVIEAVEELLKVKGLSLKPEKKAELITILYEDSLEEGVEAEAEEIKERTLRLLRLAT